MMMMEARRDKTSRDEIQLKLEFELEPEAKAGRNDEGGREER